MTIQLRKNLWKKLCLCTLLISLFITPSTAYAQEATQNQAKVIVIINEAAPNETPTYEVTTQQEQDQTTEDTETSSKTQEARTFEAIVVLALVLSLTVTAMSFVAETIFKITCGNKQQK